MIAYSHTLIESIIIMNVVNLHLTGIWANADELLNTPGSISELPLPTAKGKDNTAKSFGVYSHSNPTEPNIVTLLDDGSMNCERFMLKASKNLCSHSVAVSTREDILPIFLDWMASLTSSECNLYELSTKNVNVKASGKKTASRTQSKKTTRKETLSYRVSNREQLSVLQSASAHTEDVLNSQRVFSVDNR